MRVGFIGLGKLGLPVALAAESAGHEVAGYDPSPVVKEIRESGVLPYVEQDAQELLSKTKLQFLEPEEIADWADLVFVAVQTPHEEKYEGITRLPKTRSDFDYNALARAVHPIRGAKLIVVISTVLPGTLDKWVIPDIRPNTNLLYNPSFIAMGTTIPDFRNPEFVLIGTDGAHPGPLREFYSAVHDRPLFITTIRTAELTKVAYNTFIGLKIAFANTMMELCEKTGADVDDLVDALSLADRRIISPAYLRGGMGDGGGCHPRDNIALSWLARKHNLSYYLFEALMLCREAQTEWIAELTEEASRFTNGDIEILGKAYKPETALTVGSPATLLSNLLAERLATHEHSDPYA